MFRLVSGNAANGAEKMAEADEVEERRFQSRKGMEADNGSKELNNQSINRWLGRRAFIRFLDAQISTSARTRKGTDGR